MTNSGSERAVRQRASHLRAGVGADVQRLRQDAGISGAELARTSGVDPSFLRRIEAGKQGASLGTYARIAAVLGADVSLRLYPTTGPTIRDRHQSAIADALLGTAHPRWTPFAELAVRRPARGWIDLGFHAARESIFVATEIQSEIRRVEQLLRWSELKATALPSWEGWPRLHPEPSISRLLVVRETRANRDIAEEHRRLLRASYPADPRDALEAIRGSDSWPGAALLWAVRPHSAEGRYRIVARP